MTHRHVRQIIKLPFALVIPIWFSSILELWKRSIEVIWLKPANVPKPRMLCRAVVKSAAGVVKSFAVHKFHSCNGILAGRITVALIFFAIHFINKCFANQNVCKRTEDHKWTRQTFCHLDVIVTHKRCLHLMFVCPDLHVLSRMLLAQRNVYELVRISGQQPNNQDR